MGGMVSCNTLVGVSRDTAALSNAIASTASRAGSATASGAEQAYAAGSSGGRAAVEFVPLIKPFWRAGGEYGATEDVPPMEQVDENGNIVVEIAPGYYETVTPEEYESNQ